MAELNFPQLPPEEAVPAAQLNEYRADRWQLILLAYDEAMHGTTDPVDVLDHTHCACVVADMMHWCAKKGIAVEDVMWLAHYHFDAEQTEEN